MAAETSFPEDIAPSTQQKGWEQDTIEVPFGDMYTQSAEGSVNKKKRVFNLTFQRRPAAEAQEIEDFLEGVLSSTPFWFTPVNSDTPVQVKMVKDSFKRTEEPPSGVLVTIEVQFKESFDL